MLSRTGLAASIGLPLLAGCAAAPQPTTVPPVASDLARVIIYTVADYRPVIAHGIRLNETDIGRLNGPNQISMHDVAPGLHKADAIRAGLLGDKTPMSSQQRELKAGETWYLRVSEYGGNCRVISDAEVIVMTGLVGLMVHKAMTPAGGERRQCEYYNPELIPISDEIGRTTVNEIVYGVANPTPRLATAQDAADSTSTVTLEQVRGEWDRILPALKRHAEREIGFYDSILFATPGKTRVLEWKLVDARADESGRLDLVVEILAESLDVNRRLSTQAKQVRYGLARNEQSYAVREANLHRALLMTAQNGDVPAPSLQVVKADWVALEPALRRHFDRNSSFYETAFDAMPSSMKAYSFEPVDTLPGTQAEDYRVMVRVTAGYQRNGYRALSSGTRDLIFEMQRLQEGAVVKSVTEPKVKQ